ASGAAGYFWSDGKAFTRVYRSGDQVHGQSTSMDQPISSPNGLFYARASGPGYTSLVQLGSFGLKTLISSNDDISGGKLGWVHFAVDANAQGVLFVGDFNLPGNYHNGMGIWKSGAASEVSPLAGWGGVVAGVLPSDGTPIASVALKTDSRIPGLRSFP